MGGPYDEYVAGPGCISGQGYSGYRILVGEMKDCRATQRLVLKSSVDDWTAKEDGQDWERDKEGMYFLNGRGNGGRDEGPFASVKSMSHGVAETRPLNTMGAASFPKFIVIKR